jgi:hypothetical protein
MNPYRFSRKCYDLLAATIGFLGIVGLMVFGQENDGKHPAACALTATSHSKLMSEYTGDPAVQDIYQYSSEHRYPIVSRLGNIYGTEGNEELIALYVFLKDDGINIRTYHLFTDEKHHIMVIAFPGQVLDRSLAGFFGK